jgi:hypothetical protein
VSSGVVVIVDSINKASRNRDRFSDRACSSKGRRAIRETRAGLAGDPRKIGGGELLEYQPHSETGPCQHVKPMARELVADEKDDVDGI